ncbi:GDSL-type esterase/lipase family protein [Saccharicrinis sp. GN24d3]|uniref:GDSL-type esterase/lipase family protein n=1 Tax=Saccharicrinis sp. GN24d3 TaxID=3458416 RepID=UPI004036372A
MKKITLFIFFLFLGIASRGQEIHVSNPIRFLALGDSYTIGQSVLVSERWPNQLASYLENRGFTIGKLEIIARTGWRTDDLQNNIELQNPSNDYNLVSLLIGVNNQFQGTSFEKYPTEFRQLLNQAIQFCGGKVAGVFVLSIPDYGYTPFGTYNRATISAQIDMYNQVNRRISEELGVTYIDITTISREAEEKPQYIASDNLHPSGQMYAQWVREVIQNMDLNIAPGVPSNKERYRWNLYPNPVIDEVRGTSAVPIASIIIYDLSGEQIIYRSIQDNAFSMDISDLSSGVYFYRTILVNKAEISGKFYVRKN